MTERYRIYEEYILSPHWKELRARKLLQTPACIYCQSIKRLQVHHINYKNLHDCLLEDLSTLCKPHHGALHEALKLKGLETCQCPEPEIPAMLDWFYNTNHDKPKRPGKRKRPSRQRRNIRRAFCRVAMNGYDNGSIEILIKFLQEFLLTGNSQPERIPVKQEPKRVKVVREIQPLTLEVIDTKSGKGFSRKQLEAWGVTWPPKKGWKSLLINKLKERTTL